MSRHPEVKWAQRVDKVFITVLLPDAKNAKVNLEPDGVFSFSASAGAENHFFELKLDLHDKVNVEESKINIGVRSIFCIVEKSEKKWWKKLVRGEGKTPHYVKVDWDKWVDEDEDTGSGTGLGDLDLGGMDFSKFGNMGGMGGMEGMEGMEGMGDDPLGDDDLDDDSDDEDQEISKQEEQDTGKAAGSAKAGGDTGKIEEVSEGKAEAAP